MTVTARVHGSGGAPESSGRVVYLDGIQNTAIDGDAPRNKHSAIGQKRCCMAGTKPEHGTGCTPLRSVKQLRRRKRGVHGTKPPHDKQRTIGQQCRRMVGATRCHRAEWHPSAPERIV